MSMTLRLDQIRIDGGTQPRAAINEDVVKDYADVLTNGGDLPPITVYRDGATHWLADGFHRWHAHRKARGDTGMIEADIREGTKRDAVLHSVGANATHGLRRSNEDKRKAVTTLLEDDEWAQWSDREIARQCAVSPTFVGRIRNESSVHGGQMPEKRKATRQDAIIEQSGSKPPTAQVWEIQNAITQILDHESIDDHQALASLASGWPDAARIQRELEGKTVRKNHAKQARANARQLIQERLEPTTGPARGSIASWLTTCSTSDTNFKGNLERASIEDVKAALEAIEGQDGNKVRREILERRLDVLRGLKFICPTCGAKPEQECLTPTGIMHQRRISRAKDSAFDEEPIQEPRLHAVDDGSGHPTMEVEDTPAQPPEPAPAPDSPTPGHDRTTAIVASQKAYIERLEKRVRQLEEDLEAAQAVLTVLDTPQPDEPWSSDGTDQPDLTGWLPPLTYPDAVLAINAQLDDTTPGPRDPDHSLSARIDSYCASLARATRDLEGMTPEKLIELIYSPAERLKGRPNTLRSFLEATDALRRAHHTYATTHNGEG